MTSEQRTHFEHFGGYESNSEFTIESDEYYFDSPRESINYHSKLVMIRAERHDEIIITDIRWQLRSGTKIPERVEVVQRTDPYFGPKLLLYNEGCNYLMTAPGPDSGLLLWNSIVDSNGQRTGWEKLAEVAARFEDSLSQYDFCPQCGEPLNTLKHEKQAELGCCPNV